MRPSWHRCELCYFSEVGTDDGLWCHFDTDPLGTVENSFCARWICHACYAPWDDDEFTHDDCIDIEIELEF